MNRVFRSAQFVVAAMMASGAFAQQIEAPSGTITTTREVGPRNALHPGGNAPNYVRTAPTENIFGGTQLVRLIDDHEASNIAGEINRSLATSLSSVNLSGTIGTDVAGSALPSGPSAGGIVTSGIDSGMDAMRGALSNLPGRDR